MNYVEWQYCTFLCDNLSRLLYINIHLSSVVHHRSAFPRTMIDWLLRLWIWLTRFSHRHNLKWWNGTNNHVFLEITDLPSAILFLDGSSQRVIYSPLSLLSHFTSCAQSIPTEAPGLFQHTSSISYHREPATAPALNCDRSLTSVLSYKSCRQGSSLKFRVLPTKPPFLYLVFSSMNAYPVSRFI